jgi:spore coat protein H
MKKYLPLLLVIILISGCKNITSSDPAEAITTIPVINAHIQKDLLESLRQNRHGNVEVPAKFFFNNELLIGRFEPQGAGSRYWPKWSYQVNLSAGNLYGLQNFNLSGQVDDETMIRTEIATYLYKSMGFELFYSTDVFLKINNSNEGLYRLTERIEPEFFHSRGIPLAELVKSGFKSKFTFAVPNNYYQNFEIRYPEKGTYNSLLEFIHHLDTVNPEDIFTTLPSYLDIDEYLKYHAITTAIASIDAFANNIYLYKKETGGPYHILPWDFDSILDDDYDILYIGENPIIEKLIKNESAFNIYKAYYKFFVDNLFTEDKIFPLIDSSYERIKTAYQLDPFLGQAGYSLEIAIVNLKNYISERRRLIYQNWDSFLFPGGG